MRKWSLIIFFTIAFVTALIIVIGVRIYKSLGGQNSVLAINMISSEKKAESSNRKDPPDQYDGTIQAPVSGFDPKFVRSAPVTKGLAPDFIPLSGKLAFNAERTLVAATRVAGRLNKILLFEGYPVEKGQALAELYSPDFISAENEYLLARNTLRTIKETGNPDLTKDAQATVESARNKLRVLGASDDDVNQLEETGVVSPYFLIRSPISGTVTKRNMDPGAFLNVGDAFESISDTSKLWFLGNIYEQDYAKIKLGQILQLQSEALPGKQFTGRLSYIAPSIDSTTHILSIRCEIPNSTGELRPEIFVTARLWLGENPALLVPKTAIVHIRDANYVIVDRGGGSYQRVSVKSISLKEDQEAILSGLTGNERVVVEGAVLINEMIGEL